MVSKKTLIAAILILTVFIAASCNGINKPAPGNTDAESEVKEIKQIQIMEQFDKLINGRVDIKEYISFVDENIEFLSEENATKLIIKMEELQKEYLVKLEDEYNSNNIQAKLLQILEPEFDLTKLVPENVEDEEVKRILKDTYELGYKVDTAEGMFFPVIDYSFCGKYSQYLTEDMKDYIGIMSAESDKMPAKDAALVISWEELLERAFNMQSFLEKHKDSVKHEDVKSLYNKYVSFIVYGLNNTPLFKYEDNVMNNNAKAAYKNAIDKDGNLSKMLKGYYEVIEKNGFKLTEEVKKYREDMMKNF